MPGPIDALHFVHEAILNEANSLDAAVREAEPDPEALQERLAMLTRLLHGHTEGEELGLFSRLNERFPHYGDAYEHEHVAERQHLAELAQALNRLCDGDDGALQAARRAAHTVLEHVSAHIEKENGLVLPLVHAHFTAEEQIDMVQEILSVFTPEDMRVAVPWIVNNCSVPTATKYVDALSRAMPRDVFAAAKVWMEQDVSADHLAAIREQTTVL